MKKKGKTGKKESIAVVTTLAGSNFRNFNCDASFDRPDAADHEEDATES